MDLNIINEEDKPLLSRKEYKFSTEFKGATPKRLELRDAIARKVKGEPELTVVKHIFNKYGAEGAEIIAHVYTKKEDMTRYEHKKLLARHSEKKEEKKEAAAAN